MGIKIKREPFYLIEKIYRITAALTFYVALGVILSAVVIVPIFGSADTNWVMLLYSGFFFLFCLALCGCAVLSAMACYKTKDEYLGVQCVLHIIDFILTFLNYKLFWVFFLYGINKDSLADKFVGASSDAFVTESIDKWIYIFIALVISCVIAVLSTVKLAKERKYER